MAAQASWSGKVQIDGGQTLVLGGQMPLGVGPLFLGSDSLPVTLPKSDGKLAVTKLVHVLPAADQAHILAIKADAYSDQETPAGALTLTFQNEAGAKKSSALVLAGDLLVAGKGVLAAVSEDWVSIALSSTIQQDVNVQILVVREL